MTQPAFKPFVAPAKTRILTPTGKHMGRVYSIVDLGTQPETYMGQPRLQRKMTISWELPTLLNDFKGDGVKEPHGASARFTVSMSGKANLRKFIENWRGKPFADDLEASQFDFRKLLGQRCWVTVVHKKKTDGSMTSFVFACSTMSTEEVKAVPPPHNRPVCFMIEDGTTSPAFKELPEWQQELIKNAAEIKSGGHAQADSSIDAQSDAANSGFPC